MTIVGVVIDGATNIVSAVKECFGLPKHLYCFAHLINRIVVCDLLWGKKKNKTSASGATDDTDVPTKLCEEFDENGRYIQMLKSK